jgi:outer membrane protein
MKKFILGAICAICSFTAANAQATAPKFGHVNSQEIVQAMPEFATARTEIETLTHQYEADLQQMQEELQRKAEAFEREEATLPENIKNRRNQELQDLYQRIQQTYQDNQQALQQAQQEKMQAITTKVLEAIKAVGQDGGFVYIMDISGGIPYISTTLSTDVTALVKARLGIQ